MKHLTLLGAAVWMSLLAGCQQNELTGKMDESLDVRLQASVAGTDASSRTLLEENGKRCLLKEMKSDSLCRRRTLR